VLRYHVSGRKQGGLRNAWLRLESVRGVPPQHGRCSKVVVIPCAEARPVRFCWGSYRFCRSPRLSAATAPHGHRRCVSHEDSRHRRWRDLWLPYPPQWRRLWPRRGRKTMHFSVDTANEKKFRRPNISPTRQLPHWQCRCAVMSRAAELPKQRWC
jgi:hypothetical protein